MPNPIAQVHETFHKNDDGSEDRWNALWFWCPGCDSQHRINFAGLTDYVPEPCWEFDGNLEAPTISPSILCHNSVHLCPEPHTEVCRLGPFCESKGHLILNAERGSMEIPPPGKRILGHNLPHTVDPAWGNCHSFIKNGVWQFLNDCDHKLAGQHVPMVPMPDWCVRE